MRLLVTGSSGHLGEALVRVLGADGWDVVGIDALPSDPTTAVGSIADRAVVRECVAGVEAIVHAATLHKPHVGSHGRRAFVDTNVKVNELLYRRVDLEDVGSAHRHALERAPAIGFARHVVSATTPFSRADVAALTRDAPAVVRRRFPHYEALYAQRAGRCSTRSSALRQRPRPARAGLGAAQGLRARARGAARRRGAAQRPRRQHRRQGLPRGLHRALHGARRRP